jgi:antitoxin MazE
MKVNLVRVGSSTGLRLSKRIREQCGFEETVELHVCGNCLIVSPIERPARQGWAEAFAAAVADERAATRRQASPRRKVRP